MTTASNLQSHGSILIPSDRADRTTRLPTLYRSVGGSYYRGAAAHAYTQAHTQRHWRARGRWDFHLDLFLPWSSREITGVRVPRESLYNGTLPARMPYADAALRRRRVGLSPFDIGFVRFLFVYTAAAERIVFNLKIIWDCPRVAGIYALGFFALYAKFYGKIIGKYFNEYVGFVHRSFYLFIHSKVESCRKYKEFW